VLLVFGLSACFPLAAAGPVAVVVLRVLFAAVVVAVRLAL
jgi:hypothetical protein